MEQQSYFQPAHPVGQALLEWWQALDSNRGVRAALRRAQSPLDVALEPEYQRIRKRLESRGLPPDADDRLPAAIGVIAHLREDDALPFQKLAGRDDRPAVHPLRFRRLVEAKSVNELFPLLRRVLPLVNGRANVLELAGAIYFWGDNVRRRWIREYDGWSA